MYSYHHRRHDILIVDMILLVLIVNVVCLLIVLVVVHHETIYLDRLTPHVNSIAIVSSSMNDRMNRVFMSSEGDNPLVFVLVVHDV